VNGEWSRADYAWLIAWSALIGFVVWHVPAAWRRRSPMVEASLSHEVWGKALNRAGGRLLPMGMVATALVTLGLWLSLWVTTEPVGLILVLATLAVAVPLMLGSALLNRPKWIVPPYARDEPGALAMWFGEAKVEERHRVEINDVRPLDPAAFEPYFLATCECGWLGEIRSSHVEASRDAATHDPSGEPETVRPVA
jgi:hypothetical protein